MERCGCKFVIRRDGFKDEMASRMDRTRLVCEIGSPAMINMGSDDKGYWYSMTVSCDRMHDKESDMRVGSCLRNALESSKLASSEEIGQLKSSCLILESEPAEKA